MVQIHSEQTRQADQICQQGIDLCEQQNFLEAHKLFQKAFELDPQSARAMSWLGYTTAVVERKVQKALDLCRKAIDSHIPDVFFFRNIGKVYLLANNKRAAIGAFAKGLQIDKTNRDILNEWKVLGFRRRVVISFLDRSHWVNKNIGKFTWWFTHRDKS